MSATRELTLNPSTPTVVFAVVALSATLIVSFLGWRKSGFRRGTGLLEILRVLLVCLALWTLLQPEYREVYRPTEKPVLAVLWDASASMATRDVLLEAGQGGDTVERREWIESTLQSAVWDELRQRVDVVFHPFSAADAGEEGTDLNAALAAALSRHDNLRAAVLMSDGDWNMGDTPVVAATRLRMKEIPAFTIPLGSEIPLPDVEIVEVDPPTFSVVGKSLQIPFTVKSTLPREQRITLTLDSGDGTKLDKDIVIPAMGQTRDVIVWKPQDIGEYDLHVSVPLNSREVIADNNEKTVRVAIRAESIKVLVVESIPRWEYRYLRNALDRDPGVEVSCLLFHPGLGSNGDGSGYISSFPASIEELAKFDVVFLGDVGVSDGQLTPGQCTMLKGLVEKQASGLVFMPGMNGRQFSLQDSELSDLYPIVLDQNNRNGFGAALPANFVLTQSGRRSLLTKLADDEQDNVNVWRDLPGFQWRSPALRAKAGTDVLALHEDSRAPLLVTKTFGTGKVLFMGTDGAWRWREGVEDKYHYRFWGQVARWMAYQRHMAEGEMIRMFYSPDRPQPGGTIQLNATVLDPSGVPLADGTVEAEVTTPRGNVQRIRFQSAGTDWGLFLARFTPDDPGDYAFSLTCRETSALLNTTVSVQGAHREKVGKPARHDVLSEIAQISRGEMILPDHVATLTQKVLSLPEPEAAIRRRQIWASPVWAGMLVALLGAFWVGRKLNGTI